MSEVDKICALIVNCEEIYPLDKPEVPDAFDQFVATSKLAGALGGDRMAHARAERFQNEIENIDAHVRKNRRAAPADLSKGNDWNEEIVLDDSHTPAKMETAHDRRKRNYALWMKHELALGKTAGELIAHAAQHDAGVARLLAEVAEELEAA